MKRALPLAVGVGLLIGLGVHRLVPSVPLSAGTAAIYVGAAYVWFAFDVSLLAHSRRFDDRIDGLGYGVGLFGVSVTPLFFAHTAGNDAATVGFAVAFFGAVGFLSLSEQARRRNDRVE
ncbi:hypothetical protein ABNG02_11040 [Halorubrum ejinorense]|uniref:Uncharacterized protein n=1 Tax=Halorubrum ejinorense TaxID=425309 RepID=A0AAV3SXH7_9EURY